MTWRDRIVALTWALLEHGRTWAGGKSPWARLLLLSYLAYAGVRHLIDPMFRSWFAGITLAFHEMGHLVLAPFGHTLMLLGGSLFQLAVPLLAGVYLLVRQRDLFGGVVGAAWLSFSSYELATYVADANKERLALVGFSGRPEHDWSSLLTQWGWLNHCDTFAFLFRAGAFSLWALSMGYGGWLCWAMWRRDDSTR